MKLEEEIKHDKREYFLNYWNIRKLALLENKIATSAAWPTAKNLKNLWSTLLIAKF